MIHFATVLPKGVARRWVHVVFAERAHGSGRLPVRLARTHVVAMSELAFVGGLAGTARAYFVSDRPTLCVCVCVCDLCSSAP